MAADIDIPPNERYELLKLRILTEVQGELTTWAKRRIWLVLVAFALVGFFGVSGFISLTVGQSIEKKMDSVNAQVLSAVKSSVEAEFSARQATKSAEEETRRVNETVTKLRETLEKISSEAANSEVQLNKLSKSIESRSENVRGESQLLAESLVRRLANLETLTQTLARSTGAASVQELQASVEELEAKAKREKDLFTENSKFEVQIQYTQKDAVLANGVQLALRNRGFRTSMWTPIPDIQRDWGVSLDFLEGRVTVFHPPGKDQVGKQIVELLQTETGTSNIKVGTDRGTNPGFVVGVLIPPGYPR